MEVETSASRLMLLEMDLEVFQTGRRHFDISASFSFVWMPSLDYDPSFDPSFIIVCESNDVEVDFEDHRLPQLLPIQFDFERPNSDGKLFTFVNGQKTFMMLVF